VNLPVTNSYLYDLNGNLTNDGTRSFAYDDENELIGVWVANAWSNNFVYDGKMRRRIERDYTWIGGSWVEANEVHYIYDGNLVVQERDQNNVPKVTYTRGNDLSGSFQGAGGIGGLLARTSNSPLPTANPFATAFYHADGNGNVTYLIYTNQTMAAKYLYDPYGNTLGMSGSLAVANVYRFSSKEWNDNDGLYYYGYRFYDPNLQRWPNRDPFGDFGSLLYLRVNSHNGFNVVFDKIQLKDGLNLYEMLQNDPNDRFDAVGLDCGGAGGQTACGVACTLECFWCTLLPPPADFICAGSCMAGCVAACCADQDSCPNNPNPPRKKRGSGL
jgi:RHS repeat-associated protein